MLMNVAATIALTLFGLGADNINFDNVLPPSSAPGWTSTASNGRLAPSWSVRKDPTAPSRPNVFAPQSGATTPGELPLAIFDRIVCRDQDLSVKFKIVGGAGQSRTAGIVWRYQDQRNYYLLQFSADQKNIGLFRMENGRLRAIPITGENKGPTGVIHEIQSGQWYVAKVMVRGANIRVLFGNRVLFDAHDDTLPQPGKTGLYTRAGTIAYFDDFHLDKKS